MNAAFFPGIRRSSPFSGGRPIRAWCCFPRNSNARAACARRCATVHTRTRVDSDFGATIRGCAAPRRVRSRYLAECGHDRLLRAAACTGISAIPSKPMRGETLVGRPVRPAAWPGVLRRIHVQPRARCLESGVCAPGGRVSRARHPTHRLPSGESAPGRAWGPARCRAANLWRYCRRHARRAPQRQVARINAA